MAVAKSESELFSYTDFAEDTEFVRDLTEETVESVSSVYKSRFCQATLL